MSSNDGSPGPQSHSADSGFPLDSNKNPKIDTVDALLRIVFRMTWGDWALTAILISCLINHYFFTVLNVAQPIIDLTRLITVLISVVFAAYKVVSAYKSKELIIFFFKIHPIQLFVSIIACGAATAFFLPLILNIFKFIGDTDKITTALLASTGGIIAVFTLIKTHQKNQNDETALKLDTDKHQEQKRQFKKNIKQEAYRSYRERTRQIHAERRSRYTTAVEQLANKNAVVRLGGIYTLVGLVDEWLADKSIKEDTDRRKEGQIIINNLCSYIRAPFSLADSHHILDKDSPTEKEIEEYGRENFTKHKLEFHEEKDTRQAILHEIKLRLNSGYTINGENEEIPLEGPWSKFTYDFSKAFFFYPLDLSRSFFSHPVIFKETVFANKFNVSGSIFNQETSFSNARFTHQDFSKTFNFKGVRFKEISRFNGAIFESTANFRGMHAESEIEFSRCHFKIGAWFSGSTFKDAYFVGTEFSENFYLYPYSDVSFNGVEFMGEITTFRGAKFHSSSSFESAVFEGNLDLVSTRFGYFTKFTKAIFKENIYLAETIFPKTRKTDFTNALFRDSIYYTWDSNLPFAPMMNPLGVIFYTAKDESSKKVKSEIRYLPLGARIFNPDSPNSWDEEQKRYKDISEPASTFNDSFETLKKIK